MTVKESKPLSLQGRDVSVGDFVRVVYADHLLFVGKDPKLYRQPPLVNTTGVLEYQDDNVIQLRWERFSIPSSDVPQTGGTGVTIHRATIVSLEKL